MPISSFFNKRRCVATLNELTDALGVSGRSVLRRLDGKGYYTSYTHNSRYYTLKDIPKFDCNLIWTHKGIGFTKLNNLMDLVVHCVDRCAMGHTVKEASEVVHTDVGNQLGVLERGGRVRRVRFSSGYVYFSLEPVTFRQQLSRRRKAGEEPLSSQPDPTVLSNSLGGFSHEEIVCILSMMINYPRHSLRGIREALVKRGLESGCL